MSDETERENLADSIEELRSITTCRCDAAWRDRGLHETHCVSYCRWDVDSLAEEIDRRGESLVLLREWVTNLDTAAGGFSDHWEWEADWERRVRALVERTSQRGQT